MRAPSLLSLLLGLALAAAGCAQHHYYARMANADGGGHEALAYWSVTERALWFDESSETVRVKLQCGKTVPFQEREGGVFVLYDPALWMSPREIGGQDYCGRVLDAEVLGDIAVGERLSVEIWCQPALDDEGFGVPAPILPPGRHTFSVVQRADQPPATPPCQSTR